jgi:hypothetical protein
VGDVCTPLNISPSLVVLICNQVKHETTYSQ